MRKLLMLCLIASATSIQAQTPDTTYTVSPDQPIANVWKHRFTLTRRNDMIGVVIQGDTSAYAGSCRNAWCALVPSNATNGVGQSGGTFSSFNDAAHEVVRVWNSLHPADTLSTPVVPPVDTTPKIDSSYTNERILPAPAGSITAYKVFHKDTLVGEVHQLAVGKWFAYIPTSTTSIGSWTTLRAASYALVHRYQHPVVVPPPTTDTTHKTITIYDTVRMTVTMPPDTLHPRVILPVDTVFMRVGDPPISFQTGDTIKVPIRVLPKCSCTSSIDTVSHLIPNGVAVANAGVDTVGLHIYDWESRVGTNSVYLGTKFLGTLTQDNSGGWVAYRKVDDSMVMPRDPTTYSSKAAAMQALANPLP